MPLKPQEREHLIHIAQAYFHQDWDLECGGDLELLWRTVRKDQEKEDVAVLVDCFERLLRELTGAELKGIWHSLGSDLLLPRAGEAKSFFEIAYQALQSND